MYVCNLVYILIMQPFLPMQNMRPMPHVRIEDMGHKMGCNGVDNGKLWFDGEQPLHLFVSSAERDVVEFVRVFTQVLIGLAAAMQTCECRGEHC